MNMLLPHLFHLAAAGCTKTGFLKVGLYDGLCAGNSGELNITSVSDIMTIVANVVRMLIAASGAVAVIIIIVGGIYYITSAGDPGRVKRAKDIITNTAVGLVVIATAYAVVTSIAKGFN